MLSIPKNSNQLADVDYEALARQARQERARYLATLFQRRRPRLLGRYVKTANGRLKITYTKNAA